MSISETYEEHLEYVLKESITIKQFIEILSKYPADLKVLTTWESTINPIKKKFVYLAKEKTFVLIDADNCFYKEDYAYNVKENESDEIENK